MSFLNGFGLIISIMAFRFLITWRICFEKRGFCFFVSFLFYFFLMKNWFFVRFQFLSFKCIVLGPHKSGKSSFIRSLSATPMVSLFFFDFPPCFLPLILFFFSPDPNRLFSFTNFLPCPQLLFSNLSSATSNTRITNHSSTRASLIITKTSLWLFLFSLLSPLKKKSYTLSPSLCSSLFCCFTFSSSHSLSCSFLSCSFTKTSPLNSLLHSSKQTAASC